MTMRLPYAIVKNIDDEFTTPGLLLGDSREAPRRGISVRNSPKRRGPPLRYQMTFGVQAPRRNAMHSDSGHRGTGGDLFLRIFKAIW